MNSIFAYIFIVLTGTNGASHYSSTGPYFSSVVLIMFSWIIIQSLFVAGFQDALKKSLSAPVLLWGVFLAAPLIFMMFSMQEFARGDWANQIAIISIYYIGVQLWFNENVRAGVIAGVLTVCVIAALLNTYEFFYANNLWSTAPGRSAGWFVNPNTSSAAISIYGIIYFSIRSPGVRKMDLPILAILCVGVLLTFSRGGYVLFMLTIATALLRMRVSHGYRKKRGWSAVLGIVIALVIGVSLFMQNVVMEKNLSKDASSRLESLSEESIIDNYIKNRGVGVLYWWDQFAEDPITGLGVKVSMSKRLGPHNMFVGIAVDYGIFGLVAYLVLILNIVWRAYAKHKRQKTELTIFVLMSMAWLVLYGFASHNIIYNAFDIFALSFVVAATAALRMPHKKRKSPMRSMSGFK